MIKVLHVSAVKTWGGGENHIQNLCLELKKNNTEVENYILCVKDSEFEEKLTKLNIPYYTAPLKIKLDLRFAFGIINYVKKHHIDVIHIHDPTALTMVVIADKFYNLPNMVYSKKTSFPIKQRKGTLYKYNYPKIKQFLCVSEETKRVTELSIVEKDKIKTIYHGTTVPKNISNTVENLRSKYNILSNQKLIGLIGNHIDAKDLFTFIEVVNTIVNTYKRNDFKFIQIGSYSVLTPRLEEKVKEYQLEDYIVFTGHIHQASDYISQFDVFLMTSESEGIPQSIYESFYYKIPVVTTNAGGIAEIVKNNENGFICNIKDYKSLADSILKISENKELQNQFTEKSYTKLIENYTTSQMASKTLQVYKNISKQ